MKLFNVFSFELLIWVVALVLLWFTNPSDHHFSLCPLASIGVEWCPGCGIGRSIAWLLKGNLNESFQAHWFGIPALILLICRIITLTKNNYFRKTYT